MLILLSYGRLKHITMSCMLLIEEGGSRFSVTYGINKRSELLDMPGFDLTKCLPYDVMHTVFEGVAAIHIYKPFCHT